MTFHNSIFFFSRGKKHLCVTNGNQMKKKTNQRFQQISLSIVQFSRHNIAPQPANAKKKPNKKRPYVAIVQQSKSANALYSIKLCSWKFSSAIASSVIKPGSICELEFRKNDLL